MPYLVPVPCVTLHGPGDRVTAHTPISRTKRWIGFGLQRQFLLLMFLILTFLSFAFLAMVAVQYRSRILEENGRAALQINRLLLASIETALINRDNAALNGILSRLGGEPDIRYAAIVNNTGAIVHGSGSNEVDENFVRELKNAGSGSLAPYVEYRPAAGKLGPYLRSINPLENRSVCQPCHGSPAAERSCCLIRGRWKPLRAKSEGR